MNFTLNRSDALVSRNDGLADIHKIIKNSTHYLNRQGLINH